MSKSEIRQKVLVLSGINIELHMNGMDLIVLYLFLNAAFKVLEVPEGIETGVAKGVEGLKEAVNSIIVVDDLIPLEVKIKDEFR